MKVKWIVDDGYVSKGRTHYIEVDDDELAECETQEERDELISEAVQDAFEQKVSFYWEIVK